MRQVDGYIRVSDVAGRISVKEQRRAIEAYAAAHGLQIAERDEDLNESGGTWERPASRRRSTAAVMSTRAA
jgi:hypothetical protein